MQTLYTVYVLYILRMKEWEGEWERLSVDPLVS